MNPSFTNPSYPSNGEMQFCVSLDSLNVSLSAVCKQGISHLEPINSTQTRLDLQPPFSMKGAQTIKPHKVAIFTNVEIHQEIYICETFCSVIFCTL